MTTAPETPPAPDPWDSDDYDALVAAGLSAHPERVLSPVEGPVGPQATEGQRAPNALPSAVEGQREFTLNSAYAWSLFRPEPSMLPQIPLLRHNPVVRDR